MYKALTWRTVVPFVVFGIIVASNPQGLTQHIGALVVLLVAMRYGRQRYVCVGCGGNKYFRGKLTGQVHCSNCYPGAITLPQSSDNSG
jgi:hypothetical protein